MAAKTFTDRYSLREGTSIVLIGPPKTGKSTFLSSVAEVVPPERVRLLITKPREKASQGYLKHGLDKGAMVFRDTNWIPEEGQRQATAFLALKKELRRLATDPDIDAVLLDPGTDVAPLLDHYLLRNEDVSSPGELHNTQSYYRQLKDNISEFVELLTDLSISEMTNGHPKFVIVSWHAQPPKDDQFDKKTGTTKVSSDNRAADVEYKGGVLPMLEGSYRTKLVGDFNTALYTDVKFETETVKGKLVRNPQYVVQVRPNPARWAAVGDLPMLDVDFLPNSFGELYRRMKEHLG